MQTEKALWQSLKKGTEKDVHWTRVEAWAGAGIPDVNGAFVRASNGQQIAIEMWCELKVCRTRKFKTLDLWRPAQVAWQTKRSTVSRYLYNLISHPDTREIKIFGGHLVRELQEDADGTVVPDLVLKHRDPWSVFLDFVAATPPTWPTAPTAPNRGLREAA